MRFRIAKLAATLLTYLIVVAPLGAEIMVSTIDDSAHSYAPLENIVAQEDAERRFFKRQHRS